MCESKIKRSIRIKSCAFLSTLFVLKGASNFKNENQTGKVAAGQRRQAVK